MTNDKLTDENKANNASNVLLAGIANTFETASMA